MAAIPINKQLYSFSYVCFTAGAAGLVFSGFYVLVIIELNEIDRLSFNFCYILLMLFMNKISTLMNKLQIDVWGFRTPFLFLEWIGKNAMLVFVMAAQGIFAAFVNGWYYENEDNTLVRLAMS